MKKTGIFSFYEQVKQEAKKVSWPSKKELTTSVLVVMVAVLLFSVVTMFLDYSIHNLIQMLLNIGK